MTRQISRRSMVKAAGIGIGIGATATVTATALATPAGAAGAPLAHPGLLHTRADLDRMAAKVKAGARPYAAGFAKLTANRHAQSGWRPSPQAVVYRGSGTPENYRILYNDIHAAYQNALRYHVSGDQAHADTAVAILNAWSGKLTRLEGSADRFLAAGLYGYQFANAAELVREHGDFDLGRAQELMRSVFHPLSDDFLTRHNGAVVTNYWPNWDLTAIACVLATGIFCDERAVVERAVEYFRHGDGMGSVKHAIPVVHEGGLGEWVEAGRDQGHALLGVGLMGTVCEMAWNQGIDLYGYDDSRFLKGAQYVAKWSLGGDVPYTANTRRKGAIGGWSGSETASGVAGVDPSMTRPIWAMIANHYTKRRALPASYLTRAAAKAAPEGGGGDYGPTAGGSTSWASGRWRSPATGWRRRPAAPPRIRLRVRVRVRVRPGGARGAGGVRPQASASPVGRGDLAATGSGDVAGWAAAAGIGAVAGGLLLLRRRDRVLRRGADE
ncbi:alginate lyase family protein [Streptomyces iakyrus]|uniref:alginate lyase family protein n=1 Tax=Streptomyces iakyrus TaxID=68219 RepID=UPI0036F7086C